MFRFSKHTIAVLLLSLGSTFFAKADEGMWLPMFIKRLNYADMQKNGLKLTAEEIYSVNSSSLKDAVVSFGGFCTGEIISNKGLLLTNHHCGYGSIQFHSTVEKDYLANGFWAKNFSEELPNKELTASFLIRMEDVTAKVLNGITDNMSEEARAKSISMSIAAIKKEAEAGTHYNTSVRPFFNGNEYYLFVYETFKDVRLVGTPPSSIGKFGGETDNWMWPRHTGDFSVFRVYAGKDGKPAEYSIDNVPLTPRHFFPISLNGVKEGDFSMIMGYPGRTNRYLTSYGVKLATELENPTRVKIRRAKLDVMEQYGNKDRAIKIQYAANYAQISNYWKYFIGQTNGLKRLKVIDKKLATENEFRSWIAADASRNQKYGQALPTIEAAYKKWSEVRMFEVAFTEALMGSQLNNTAYSMIDLAQVLSKMPKSTDAEVKETADKIKADLAGKWKDYNINVDRSLYEVTLKMFAESVPASQLPSSFNLIKTKYKGDYAAFAKMVFEKSFMVDKAKLEAFLAKPDLKTLEKDPAYVFFKPVYDFYISNIASGSRAIQTDLEKGNRIFVAGLMEMQKGKKTFYPNANSTMRLTYGKVLPYSPKDGVEYEILCDLDGVMEKENPEDPEFEVPARLKELWRKKDYGRYAENGTVPVAFISNNDITGGNSGSPVINAKGHLIGTAFDGNWEAMSGDIAFETDYQRTISCDIRYVLFIIDKYAGATNLINEMVLVRDDEPAALPALPAVVPAMAPPAPKAPMVPVANPSKAVQKKVNSPKAIKTTSKQVK